jgi:dTDP-D-glucose 4,6-dehydratase
LRDIENKTNYKFIKGDIVDSDFINTLFEKEKFDAVIHLAAESHVDRSITNPNEFVMTNVVGTVNLLNAARRMLKKSIYSIMFQLTKYMDHLDNPVFSQKKQNTIRTPPTLPAKPVQTIL